MGGHGASYDMHSSPRDDFLSAAGLERAWKLVAAVKPKGLVVFEPECKLWLRFKPLPSTNASSAKVGRGVHAFEVQATPPGKL